MSCECSPVSAALGPASAARKARYTVYGVHMSPGKPASACPYVLLCIDSQNSRICWHKMQKLT